MKNSAHFLGAVNEMRRSGLRQGVSASPSTFSIGPVSTSQPFLLKIYGLVSNKSIDNYENSNN